MTELKQLSVFVENKTGRLVEITGALAKSGVDIRALSIADTTDYGILRLIVNDPEKALESLKQSGMTVSLTTVIAVEIPDTPGALNNVVAILSENGISIEYMYAFLNPTKSAACVILRVEDNLKAAEVLNDNGISLVDSEKLYEI